MKEKYSELFKTLILAQDKDELEGVVKDLLSSAEDKHKLQGVISSLCGVELNACDDYDEYMSKLRTALSNYSPSHKVVEKIHDCSMDCITVGGETLCQKSCPFNAIMIKEDEHTTYIDSNKCTDCGFCVEACPNGNILDKTEFIPLRELLLGGAPVIAAVAPAIIGQFGDKVTISKLRSSFKKLGFTDMVEVAFFADMLTLKEAVEFNHLVNKKDDLMITSCCCPMWVAMLKRVYQDLVKHVSPSVSPMIAAARVLKKLNPNCKVVFIGPCIAKKSEAKEKDLLGDVDFVLTFAELKQIFEAFSIVPEELEEDHSVEYASRGGRLYARTGGVSIAVGEAIHALFPHKYELLSPLSVDGVVNCKEALNKALKGELNANFIEGMGCTGGCVGGPKAIIPAAEGTKAVNHLADMSEIKVSVDSHCMNEILAKINIHSAEDFNHAERISIFEREF